MNNRLHKWLPLTIGGVVLAGVCVFPPVAHWANADVTPHAPELLDHNPRIHHALDALREARRELAEARHDYHGKKRDAMEAVDRAIERLDEIKDYED